jgi:hypothetical protein
MNSDEFSDLIHMKLDRCKDMLGVKAGVYANNNDRLHNFKSAARKLDTIPEIALRGMRIKHEVAIDDFINALAGSITGWTTMEEWEEKIGDSINYLLLLYALVVERYDSTFSDLVPEDVLPSSGT